MKVKGTLLTKSNFSYSTVSCILLWGRTRSKPVENHCFNPKQKKEKKKSNRSRKRQQIASVPKKKWGVLTNVLSNALQKIMTRKMSFIVIREVCKLPDCPAQHPDTHNQWCNIKKSHIKQAFETQTQVHWAVTQQTLGAIKNACRSKQSSPTSFLPSFARY